MKLFALAMVILLQTFIGQNSSAQECPIEIKIDNFNCDTQTLEVVFTNTGKTPLNLWRERYSRGYYSLNVFVQHQNSQGLACAYRKSKSFTVNPPSTFQLLPNKSVYKTYKLADPSWILVSEIKNGDMLRFSVSITQTEREEEYKVSCGVFDSLWHKAGTKSGD